jgi:methionine-rich copper-binding protein CopC
MASSNPNLVSETSPAKVDMEFSEDVEASRSSSKHDENTHIQHAELTDQDVCLPSQALARCQVDIPLLTL